MTNNVFNSENIKNITGYSDVLEITNSSKISAIRERALSLAADRKNPELIQLLGNIPFMNWIEIYIACFPFITGYREECAKAVLSSLESIDIHTKELQFMLSELEVLYARDVANELEANVIKLISDKIYHNTQDKRYKLLRDYSRIYFNTNLEKLRACYLELLKLIEQADEKSDQRNIAYLTALTVQRMVISKYGKETVITESIIRILLEQDDDCSDDDYYYDDDYDYDYFDDDYDDNNSHMFFDQWSKVPDFCDYIRLYHCPEIFRVFQNLPYLFDSNLLLNLYHSVREYEERFMYLNEMQPIFKIKSSFCQYSGLYCYNTCFDNDKPQ